MSAARAPTSPEALVSYIGTRVRDLRKERSWTQARLASELRLSQGRLSQLERGEGSFTAEQFLTVLRLFNVPASDFLPAVASVEDELQNALARLGARHLLENTDVLPSDRLREANAVVREVLADASSPRMITALAPVIVENIDRINLTRLALDLSQLGLARRLFWLVDNILESVLRELAASPKAARARQLRRAQLVLGTALDSSTLRASSAKLDILDKVRTRATLLEINKALSPSSKRWGIGTALQPEDFYDALRSANAPP